MLTDRLFKGQIIEGEASDLGMRGEGVVKYGGATLFVPFALPGERVRAKITHAKKDIAFADLIEVLSVSNDRVKPVCPYFKRCGGCDMQHIKRELQLEIKRGNLKKVLSKNAGIDIDIPLPVRLNDYEYRNKLSMPFAKNAESGRVYLGFYERGSHKVVPIKRCPLNGGWAAELIAIVTAWANENSVSVYDENTGKGLLRHLAARKLSDLSVTLVINGNELPSFAALVDALNERFEGCAVYVSENTENTNVILGKTVKLIGGEERPQKAGRFSAVISPLSFFQVNDEIRDALYKKICDEAGDFDGEIVELYSGVGLLTAELLTRLPKARAVSAEIMPEAVEDAKELFKSLGLSGRATAVCRDAADFISGLSKSAAERILILDPPRKGVDERVVRAARNAEFKKIIYVSCNAATLARDLKLFMDGSAYSLLSVTPFDMFPQTAHVETVVLMSRKDTYGLQKCWKQGISGIRPSSPE